MSRPNSSSTPSDKHSRKKLRDIQDFGSPISRYSDGVERSGLVPITPMPDFNNMDTPEVQKQAQKYGMKKRLAKSKLRTKLKEVYMYTHQISEENPSGEITNSSSCAKESAVDLQDSFQQFRPLDSPPREKRNDPEIITLDDTDSSSVVIINTDDADVSVKEISSLIQEKEQIWDVDRIPTLAERIRKKSSKNPVINNNDIVVVEECSPGVDPEYSVKGLIQPAKQDDSSAELVARGCLLDKTWVTSIIKHIPPGEHDDKELDIRQITESKSSGDQDPRACNEENLLPGGQECFEEGHSSIDSKETKDVLHVQDDVNGRVSSEEDEDPVLVRDVSSVLLFSDSKEDDDLMPLQGEPPSTCSGSSNHMLNLEGFSDNTSFKKCKTSETEIETNDLSENSPQEPSTSDEDDIVGSDHDELHNSLFISIHESLSRKQCESSSSSSDQEEVVYLSLKDRILAKKGLLQLPDEGLRKIADEELSETPRKRKKNYEVKVDDEKNVPERSTTKKGKISKPKKRKLDKEEKIHAMYNAVLSNDFIYTSVLRYKPLFLSQFKKLMDENDIKCSVKDLMDFLDYQAYRIFITLFLNYPMNKDRYKDQEAIDVATDNLEITLVPFDNTKEPKAVRILFHDAGDTPVSKDTWQIYMFNLSTVEVPKDYEGASVKIEHIMGGLYKLTPQNTFPSINSGMVLRVHVTFEHAMVSRYSALPNWYACKDGFIPKVFKSTTSETLDFVDEIDTPQRWKKSENDKSNPFTPRQRYLRYYIEDSQSVCAKPVLPTLLKSDLKKENSINISEGTWKIQMDTDLFSNEARFLADHFNIQVDGGKSKLESHFIRLTKEVIQNQYGSDESYAINLDDTIPAIQISASTSAGMFYGIQSLLSLADLPRENSAHVCLPAGTIMDAPRFPYRGLHIDVSRNFASVEEICKIIKVMSMYKMNKLHFHLTDDEGWRLEIKDIPELTEIGAIRDHLLSLKGLALNPMLGSGPDSSTSGSGFYTAQDYQVILREASKHHVQVIPEIDIPGHSYAAILALKGRYKKYKEHGNMKAALEYLPVELDDTSVYESVQKFKRNTLNPCIDGTWRFVEKIITTLKELHAPIQPLKVFHCGGDEVPLGAWSGAPACRSFYGLGHDHENQDSDEEFDKKMTRDIQEHFLVQVKQLCKKHDLEVAVWNDGVRDPKAKPNGEDSMKVYAWRLSFNTEEYNPNILANSGYKVILAPATHLYFDHPYEPDPEENGLHWCVRMVDTPQVFGMKPFNIYSCQETTPEGEHEKLVKRESILGMQVQLWRELNRTDEALEYMLFPRILAAAERAWHQAPWEDDNEVSSAQTQDWNEFATTVGTKELKRLEKMKVMYRIPPPGFNIVGEKLMINSVYPGLKYKYRKVGDKGWTDCRPGIETSNFERDTEYEMVTSSFDGKRMSRSVKREGFREDGVQRRHPTWGPDIPCYRKRK